jgi:hypothetical protein
MENIMKSAMTRVRMICSLGGMAVLLALAAGPVQAQNPQLVGQLTKELSISRTQASGGAGALFGLAKSRMSADDFSKVAAAVPGMNGFLKAAPSPSHSGLSGLAGSLPGEAGGLASVAGSFHKLGLSPGMAEKFVPVMTKFVEAKGGASTASLLSGALK